MNTSLAGRARGFLSSPLLRASLTSGSVMMLGDALAQQIQRKGSVPFRQDWQRTLRFGIIGATLHGPYFFSGMRAVDRYWGPARDLRTAATKTLTSQAILFPPFIALVFSYIGLLEGKNFQQCIAKVEANYKPAFIGGTFFWPTANIFNFLFVPPHARILYVSIAGLIWNTGISWMNARQNTPAMETTQQAIAS